MIIEILKAIESEIGIEIVINFLCLILGMGLGGGITDAIYSYTEKGEENDKTRQGGSDHRHGRQARR